MTDRTDPTLAEVGEFTVIGRITTGRVQPPGVTLGPGDDAAVVTVPDGRVVISTGWTASSLPPARACGTNNSQ